MSAADEIPVTDLRIDDLTDVEKAALAEAGRIALKLLDSTDAV